jgi:NhaA family Na+:H+ antiporter
LKVFLIAFAIVDDLGAVIVIAAFYSGTIKWSLMGISLLLLALLFFLSSRKYFSHGVFLSVGVIIWYLFLKAGIHPTIAGVLMALTIPIRREIEEETYVNNLCDIVDDIKTSADPSTPLLTEKQIEGIDELEDWTEKVQSPLQHLEHKLHNYVAYLIMPLFALSNAGVSFQGGGSMDSSFAAIIAICLIGGKLIGVSFFSWLAVKMGFAELPDEVNFLQVIGVALLAGVGFTMSIFVANLAFYGIDYLLDSAKAGILMGSIIAGLSGFLVLRLVGRLKTAQ